MDFNQPEVAEAEVEPAIVCANCNVPVDHSGSGTPLCISCRDHFVKYPIPLWIKLFGLGILLILFISFIGLPQSLSTGIHFKRGKKAAEDHNYITAQKEFQAVASQYPGYLEAQAQLFVAAYHNRDLPTLFATSNKLEGKRIDDESLFNLVNRLMLDIKDDFPSDSFTTLIQRYGSYDSIPESTFRSFLQNNEFDYFALVAFASRASGWKDYRLADSALNIALDHNGHNQNALAMKITVKRQLKEVDSAYYFVDRILSVNKESVYALSAKSRILLSEKKDDEALRLAKQALSLKEDDGYALASVALALHFKGDLSGRDDLVKRAAKDSTMTFYFTYVNDVISGKENLRN
jgi:tetratricopeptide (TPR) repeat protein